jgi:hypothetical protein
MTNLTHRGIRGGVTLLAVIALFVLPCALSSRLAAQGAGAGNQDRWEATIKKFEDADKVTPPPQNAIVFVGASSIVRWNLPGSFPELGPRAINRGFGGSLAADSTRYAERIVIPYKPRIVVFYAGDNDVEAKRVTRRGRPAHVARRLQDLERRAQTTPPAQSVEPVDIQIPGRLIRERKHTS